MGRPLLFDLCRKTACVVALALLPAACMAQQPASSGVFVLHKFAHAIGRETYSISEHGDAYMVESHFLFTDRGKPVPLDTTFIARAADMKPRSYSAEGYASRGSEMDDAVKVVEFLDPYTHQSLGHWYKGVGLSFDR